MAFETISLGTHPAGTGGDTARTAFEKVNRNFLAVDVLAAAMSQAQFDANRNANKEIYAASGWVSFGNHESGKQVNECKPGLYTVLSTANTLRIGKAGGLGYSETDNASVHIDGVVFNLTNQFVLTLPPHPTSILPERMDMYGLESEKVEISAASPNAYQGGLRGVGAVVNLFTATDQQKKEFFAQNSNTTYIGTDGKIYQWQLYKISFAGTTDGVSSPSEQGYSLNSFGDLWLKAGKNLLYFGIVLRLNNGGYHPSFNPLGAAKFVGDTFWYNTSASISSKEDCFVTAKLLTGSGAIASSKSGRPDGRYYDAIYADGQGGVFRDMRYSAIGVDLVDFYEADHSVKAGSYRGFENSTFTKIDTYTTSSGGVSNLIALVNYQDYALGDSVYVEDSTGAYLPMKVTGTGSSLGLSSLFSRKTSGKIVHQRKGNSSYGGSFLQTDVIGNPVNILATPQLANGWHGNWIPVVPDGSNKSYQYTRKALAFNYNYSYTTDGGVSWTMPGNMTALSPSNITNSHTISHGSSTVIVINYPAFAKQTENSDNAEVYGGHVGVGRVYSGSYSAIDTGSLLCESLLNKILTSATNLPLIDDVALIKTKLQATKKLATSLSWGSTEHNSIFLNTPINNSPAFKALNYNVNLNQQAFIQYAYTELKHNGTNWGDDSKIAIVDNQSTKTDLNGNTVLVGTAKLKEPIGWIKNKV